MVDVHAARTALSRLIVRVEAGGRSTSPARAMSVDELVPHRDSTVRFGTAAGTMTVTDDAFDWPDADLADQFHGS